MRYDLPERFNNADICFSGMVFINEVKYFNEKKRCIKLPDQKTILYGNSSNTYYIGKKFILEDSVIIYVNNTKLSENMISNIIFHNGLDIYISWNLFC